MWTRQQNRLGGKAFRHVGASTCLLSALRKPRRRTGSPFSSRGRRAGALLLSSFEIGASVGVGELLAWCRGGWPRFSEDHDRRNRTKACNEEQGEHAQERLPVLGCYGGHMRRQGAACGTDVLITQSVLHIRCRGGYRKRTEQVRGTLMKHWRLSRKTEDTRPARNTAKHDPFDDSRLSARFFSARG